MTDTLFSGLLLSTPLMWFLLSILIAWPTPLRKSDYDVLSFFIILAVWGLLIIFL